MKNIKNRVMAIVLAAATAATLSAQSVTAYAANKINEVSITAETDLTSVNLKSANIVKIREGVTSIGDYEFKDCTGLKEVYIPASVQHISTTAFNGCTSIEKFSVNSSNEDYKSYGNALFTADGATLVRFNTGADTDTYNIPTGTKAIADNAFLNAGLKAVSIPKSVTDIGSKAFYNVPAEFTNFSQNGIVYIGSSAFEGTKIAEIWLTGAEYVGNRAFASDSALTIAHIGTQLHRDYTGTDIFYNCPKLKDVKYAGSKDQWAALGIRVNSDTLVSFQAGGSSSNAQYILVYDTTSETETETTEEPSETPATTAHTTAQAAPAATVPTTRPATTSSSPVIAIPAEEASTAVYLRTADEEPETETETENGTEEKETKAGATAKSESEGTTKAAASKKTASASKQSSTEKVGFFERIGIAIRNFFARFSRS